MGVNNKWGIRRGGKKGPVVLASTVMYDVGHLIYEYDMLFLIDDVFN